MQGTAADLIKRAMIATVQAGSTRRLQVEADAAGA
jgi:DNA polymerase I-like protein with 3'-5' exonuclease and polymerase domains